MIEDRGIRKGRGGGGKRKRGGSGLFFYLFFGAEDEYQEDGEDDQYYCVYRFEEFVYQVFFGVEFIRFFVVLFSVCDQVVEIERRCRWGEGVIQSQGQLVFVVFQFQNRF